uniref:Uncharacterized protein n=1 Tax=Sphaerodactylus townsendi TaxID=933632 RepID=A0ACB8F6L4_9SAUR
MDCYVVRKESLSLFLPWTTTDRMKTPSCRYTLLPSLLDETFPLETKEDAEQENPPCAATDAPALCTEDFHEPVLNEKSNIVHSEEIQKPECLC